MLQFASFALAGIAAGNSVDYDRDVLPILSEHCYP